MCIPKRTLKWNEEYRISFESNSIKFSTPFGRGFFARFEVEKEVERLKSLGAKNVKVSISKWS